MFSGLRLGLVVSAAVLAGCAPDVAQRATPRLLTGPEIAALAESARQPAPTDVAAWAALGQAAPAADVETRAQRLRARAALLRRPVLGTDERARLVAASGGR
jgi:hypothetical protein